ncbi:MAG: lysophospholipid acyltransferase family protein [Pseudomonadota bacterium]
MLRSMIILALGVVVTGYLSACCIIFGLISPGENKIHHIARIWAKILLLLSSTRVNVIGAENVRIGKPQIFMSNHQSDFDIFIVLGFIPGQFRWIAKKELFKIPIFGGAMRNAGYIEINRQDHEKALKSLDIAAQKIREGKSVMTFPEGTRSEDSVIKPFKQGMFHLAIKAGVPIVPVSIIGAGEIMPKRSLRINPGKVTIMIDKPIDVTGYTVENRALLIERVRNVIVNNCNRGAQSETVKRSPAAEDPAAYRET